MLFSNNDSDTQAWAGPEREVQDVCTDAETVTCAGVRAAPAIGATSDF